MSTFENRDQVAAKLREICVESLCLADRVEDIRDDSRLKQDLNADSLDCVELTMFAEEEFGLDAIPEDEMDAAKTFGQLVDLICAKLGLAPA